MNIITNTNTNSSSKNKIVYSPKESNEYNISYNNTNINIDNINNNSSGSNEDLFWTVFRNKKINKQIFSKLDSFLSPSYESLYDISFVIDRYENAKEIFIDKVKSSQYLFIDFEKLFRLIKNDFNFYQRLFNNQIYTDQIPNHSSLLNQAILSNSLAAVKGLVERFNFIPTKDIFRMMLNNHSLYGSLKMLKYLKFDLNIKSPTIESKDYGEARCTESNPLKKFKSLYFLYSQDVLSSRFFYDVSAKIFKGSPKEEESIFKETFKLKYLVDACKIISLIINIHNTIYNGIDNNSNINSDNSTIINNNNKRTGEEDETKVYFTVDEIKLLKFTKDQLNSNLSSYIINNVNNLKSIKVLVEMYYLIIKYNRTEKKNSYVNTLLEIFKKKSDSAKHSLYYKFFDHDIDKRFTNTTDQPIDRFIISLSHGCVDLATNSLFYVNLNCLMSHFNSGNRSHIFKYCSSANERVKYVVGIGESFLKFDQINSIKKGPYFSFIHFFLLLVYHDNLGLVEFASELYSGNIYDYIDRIGFNFLITPYIVSKKMLEYLYSNFKSLFLIDKHATWFFFCNEELLIHYEKLVHADGKTLTWKFNQEIKVEKTLVSNSSIKFIARALQLPSLYLDAETPHVLKLLNLGSSVESIKYSRDNYKYYKKVFKYINFSIFPLQLFGSRGCGHNIIKIFNWVVHRNKDRLFVCSYFPNRTGTDSNTRYDSQPIQNKRFIFSHQEYVKYLVLSKNYKILFSNYSKELFSNDRPYLAFILDNRDLKSIQEIFNIMDSDDDKANEYKECILKQILIPATQHPSIPIFDLVLNKFQIFLNFKIYNIVHYSLIYEFINCHFKNKQLAQYFIKNQNIAGYLKEIYIFNFTE
ncbi:hypothetical protein DICPUDRAFT_82028 [Dictyostelium purpureum]|uniref:Uncharacterized protein n=1 Tax=Dictyostelium purpureum TaxID=5786 RepID=F0ZVB1_DICPU|nr:uncharacterized protein DICPUDRAFT_82028 [Dictyostelium purpureum]EGC32103.1 hypothetical protein DICPUDRAFT_82028 [Dictyostelium purpureum]|eukprot:XP_003291353.1 hypothetical protein DICPUDRAFT_82028 [Dictyostelium purpureum]